MGDWEKQLSAFVLPIFTAVFQMFYGGSFGGDVGGESMDIFKYMKDKNWISLPENCGLPIDDLKDAFIKKTELAYDGFAKSTDILKKMKFIETETKKEVRSIYEEKLKEVKMTTPPPSEQAENE